MYPCLKLLTGDAIYAQRPLLEALQVENCLHLQKDQECEEDKHVVRRGGWGEVWTVLTNVAVSLVNLLHQKERKHLSLRTWCSRLVRKGIRFSKTAQMHKIVIGLAINVRCFGYYHLVQ